MINILLLQNLINFAARLAQADLVTKTDFDNKLSNLNRKITSNKTKHLLFENEFKKSKTFDSIYFRGKSDFENDGTQNYLVFQPIHKYFETAIVNNNINILSWKSKEFSYEKISSIKTTGYMLNSYLDFYDRAKIRVKFNGTCLKQDHSTLFFS